MIIRKYGIELHRLTHDDIELVRNMRNRDDIRLKMLDQHIITSKEQEEWFQSINNMYNFYFILLWQGKKVGLTYGKNTDWEKRENEGGMFIWEPSLVNGPVPAKASILMMELSFELVRLERTFAQTSPANPKAKSYNLAMGYTSQAGTDRLVLTRNAYSAHIPKLRKIAACANQTTPLSIDDIAFPTPKASRNMFANLPDDVFAVFRPKLDI